MEICVRNFLENPYVDSTFSWQFLHPRLSDLSLEVITALYVLLLLYVLLSYLCVFKNWILEFHI